MKIIPNKVAYPQALKNTYEVCNGTWSTFAASAGGHPKVMIGCDYSIHTLGGQNGGTLMLQGQEKIGDGDWVNGQSGTLTIKPNNENRYSFKFSYPHYRGVAAGVTIQHRVLVAKANADDQITLHKSLVNPEDCVPTGSIWKQYFFEGEEPVTFPTITSWTTPIADNGHNWSNVIHDGTRYVAIATTGALMTSVDGLSWSVNTDLPAGPWIDIAYGNGVYVAVAIGAGSNVMYSTDLVLWTPVDTGLSALWAAVEFGAGKFVITSGSNGLPDLIASSPDGVTWTERESPIVSAWTDLVYDDGTGFIATSYSDNPGNMITSPDGVIWTLRDNLPEYTLRGLATTNGIAVATEDNGDRVIRSTNGGATWEESVMPVSAGWRAIIGGDGLFLAISDTVFCTSTDGLSWTSIAPPPGPPYPSEAGAYDNGIFVVVGGGSASKST